MSKKLLGAAIAIALAAGSLGYQLGKWQVPSGAPDTATAESGVSHLTASFPDLTGQPQRLDQWRKEVLIVNFWATWCNPCREEIPTLIETQRKYGAQGVNVVGVALDELAPVQAYMKSAGINYPVLMGDLGGLEWMRRAGNRADAVPFTVIFDRTGQIAAAKAGILRQPQLENEIQRLLVTK